MCLNSVFFLRKYFNVYSQMKSLLQLECGSGYGLKYHVSISCLPSSMICTFFTFVFSWWCFSSSASNGSRSSTDGLRWLISAY